MRMRPSDMHILPSGDRLSWARFLYQSSFADYDPTWSFGGFALDELGYVMLKGLIKNPNTQGAGVTIATLPVGFRPSVNDVWNVFGYAEVPAGQHRVDVFPDGQIVFYPNVAGYPVYWMSLMGVRFKPENAAELATAASGTGS